jgi:hypothetical protein
MDPVSLWLTEGGLETWLVYHERVALPHFAAFDLMRRPGGRAILERHYRSFVELGVSEGVGVILESATWRASADWGARLGYDARQLEVLHHELVDLLVGVRRAFQPKSVPMFVAARPGHDARRRRRRRARGGRRRLASQLAHLGRRRRLLRYRSTSCRAL